MAWYKVKGDFNKDLHVNLDRVSMIEVDHRMGQVRAHDGEKVIEIQSSAKEIEKLEAKLIEKRV